MPDKHEFTSFCSTEQREKGPIRKFTTGDQMKVTATTLMSTSCSQQNQTISLLLVSVLSTLRTSQTLSFSLRLTFNFVTTSQNHRPFSTPELKLNWVFLILSPANTFLGTTYYQDITQVVPSLVTIDARP